MNLDRFRHPVGRQYYDAIEKVAKGEVLGEEDNFFVKGLTSGSASSGAEFIPEGYSAKIIWELYENNWARQLFGTWVVTQGLKENIPKFSTKLAEASAISSPVDALPSELTSTTSIEKATITTTEVELELKTFAIRLEVQNKFISYNVNPQIESLLREEIARAMSEMEEDLIVNGDTESSSASNINYTYNSSSNIHGVNTATGDNEHLLLFDGLRKSATGTAVTNAGAAYAAVDFTEAIKSLGVFARHGRDKIVLLVNPDLYANMLTWDEIETMEKYSGNATIVTGEVFRIYGIRVILTDKLPCTERATLSAASGLREASANSYHEWMMLYTDTVILGVPNKPDRTFNIKKKEWPEYDRIDLIAIEDFGLAIKWPTAIVKGYYGI